MCHNKVIMALTDKQSILIEKLGLEYERNGMSPIEARIIALLLVSDETELTFDQIRELLSISKSATSNAINILLKVQQIEYITKPGDRKRYFTSRVRNWENDAKTRLMEMLKSNEILKEVLAQRTENTPEFNKSLQEIVEFMEFLQKEMIVIFDKWQHRT